MRLLLLLLLIFYAPTAKANWLVGIAPEYRWLHLYGQSTGVPTYQGFTFNPEIKKSLGFLAIYGGYTFGTLPNTANSVVLKEDFKYRVFSAGTEAAFDQFFVRLGVIRHQSKDIVDGQSKRTILFNGWGGHLGVGVAGYLSRSIQIQVGMDLQHARFSPHPQANLNSRKDLLSYSGHIKLSWILTSSKRMPYMSFGGFN